MYTVQNETVSQRIESYCRTWRLWIENAEGVISGDSIMSSSTALFQFGIGICGTYGLSEKYSLSAIVSWTLPPDFFDFTQVSKMFPYLLAFAELSKSASLSLSNSSFIYLRG